MRLTETPFGNARPIDGYGPGFFRIGGQVHRGGLIVWAAGQAGWAGFDDTETLVGLADQVDVIFLGTGAEISHAPAAFRALIEGAGGQAGMGPGAGIGLEVMATPTACRTYNVLLSEGRRVAAALLPV